MIPAIMGLPAQAPMQADGELHILVVARDADTRYRLSSLLLDAGLRVTMAATFGVVEVLLGASEAFDLMVTAQSAEEIAQFGVPQLARSIDCDLPILVLEFDTADSPAVLDMVHHALSRWPLRERVACALH